MLRQLIAPLLFMLTNAAWAGTHDVLVDQAWLRESVPGQDTASVQLNLTSIKPATLIAVTSPLANAVTRVPGAASGVAPSAQPLAGAMFTVGIND